MKRARTLSLITLMVLSIGTLGAETIRVTSWNLGITSQEPDSAVVLQRAAATLNSLEPDVILLQGVENWQMCDQLIGLLTSGDFQVLVCSSFRGTPPNETDRTQVAIIARRKAYFTWSESWQTEKQQPLPRGVAFAAIKAGTQNLGLFTALSGNQRTADALPERVLAEVDAINQWDTNKAQTFVVGASFDAGARQSAKALRRSAAAFDKAGLVDALEEMPAELRSTQSKLQNESAVLGDCLFAGPMGVPTNPRISATRSFMHYPVTCDVELDPEKVGLALDIRADQRREKQARTDETLKKVAYSIGGGLLGVVVIAFTIQRRSRRRIGAKTKVVQRGGAPASIEPRPAPSPGQVRPIIFVEAPGKREPGPLRARPVLRLQKPPQPREASMTPTPRPPPLPPLEMKEEERSEPDEEEDSRPTPSARLAGIEKSDVRQGIVKELTAWLKHKLVRRLVDDRAQLLEAQKLATRMATTLDTRLARIEAQIQQQNQAYIQRIEELNKELAAAREENRELIRDRIAQVKAEMEAARVKVLAEANLDNTSLRL